ncbi:MAG: 3-dehydroquinate synthase [Chitinophagales bacterium]
MKIELENYVVSVSVGFHDQVDWIEKLKQKKYSSIFVLADENTQMLCYPLIKEYIPLHSLLLITSGEKEKNIDTTKNLWNKLIDGNAERNSLLINLGGGVIGDMGGFVASTYKRGFDFINIPTTLLAQVDASVGGKLGIDHNGIKNIIGVFRDPRAVLICTDFIRTLPPKQIKSGFAEILKHGLISDKKYWDIAKQINLNDFTDWARVIERSVLIKKDIVEQDPFESGLRKILNFGHTIGHAVETWSMQNDEQPLLHGEAIAIGMICEAWLSKEVNNLTENECQEITKTILNYFDKYNISVIPFESIIKIMRSDKKNANGAILFSLLNRIGSCDFNIEVSNDVIKKAIEFYSEL